MGILKRAIAKDASVVASAVDATDIVAEIERIHKTSAVVTAALGRLSIAACMMGYDLKNEKDTVTLCVKGGGPAGMLVAVADSHGNVKADVDQPVVELPLNAKGKLDVGGASGNRRYTFCCERSGHERTLCGRCSAGFRRDCRGRGAVLRYQ